MSKNGKPVTKHIVGLGDVTSYEDVPDFKEANRLQERPQVSVSGGQKVATQSVGDEYHTRPATQEELKSATAKAIAGQMATPAPKPATIDRTAMADSIAAAVARQKHNVPVPDGHSHPHVSTDEVTGDEADNAPNGQSEKKKAQLKVVNDNTNLDKELDGEIDKVEPVDERYGISGQPTRGGKKSLGVDERVYVPGVKGIGVVTKAVGDTLTVTMENESIITVESSEVTPLGNINKSSWYGTMKGDKKKKKKSETDEEDKSDYAKDSLKKKDKKTVGPNGMTVDASNDSKPAKSEAEEED